MPLSRDRDRARKRLSTFQPNSNLDYTRLSNLKQERLLGLRDIIKGISLAHLDTRLPDDIGNDWDDIGDATDGLPDIDADGDLIPNY